MWTGLSLTHEQYPEVRSSARWFLNAPRHMAAAQGSGRVVGERDGRNDLEKSGIAGDIAESDFDETSG